jgi:two-component system chemotaxis response regulator CheB
VVTTRVLVVDDAVVVRRIVAQVLESEPDIEVVTAANGRIALARLVQARPDLVLLDVEMPELDGLSTLRELRTTHPRLPVVMFSTLTERGAATTLEAMSLGATDYVTKPANVGSVNASIEAVRSELVPKIRALCAPRPPAPAAPSPRPRAAAAPGDVRVPGAAGATRAARTRPIELVAIGSSTGGPRALHEVLEALPGTLPVPIVVVQHMPTVFTRLLAERLDATCSLQVREAAGGERIGPGEVWIAPGGSHLVVRRRDGELVLAIDGGPPENSCRPAVDVLLRSVAEAVGQDALAVVLTGMGADGARGASLLHDAGAAVLAQDEATSVVWGMPGAVVRAGAADDVLPLDQVAGAIVDQVAAGRRDLPQVVA